jgi:putative ABC transport system ATP-binding protein
MTATPVLQLRAVTRVHGSGHLRVEALSDVSLEVEAGELVAVMGPSGSGKTTLLSLAGGLDAPTSGSVVVEGIDLASLGVAGLARLRRRRIGYVFQQLNLIDGLTAAENVSLPLELDGIHRRAARREALEALEAVALRDMGDRFPDALSGGEQQRVAIARAVVGDRALLLADEPTGALDSVTGETVLRLLRGHCDGGGSGVLVTHDARMAAWADRIVFLRDGRIVDRTDPPLGPESLLANSSSR